MAASTITAQIITQLAKRAGLKVAGVADLNKHRQLLMSLGTGKRTKCKDSALQKLMVFSADLLIDRNDLEEAKRTLRKRIPGYLRFAIDVVGSETASWCQEVLAAFCSSRYSSPTSSSPSSPPTVDPLTHGSGSKLSHLVTLTGSPKTPCSNVQVHQVPIKLFHVHQKIGGHLSKWLYELLDQGALKLPEVEYVDGGLGAVNQALERLRDGTVSGKRLVVRTKDTQVSV